MIMHQRSIPFSLFLLLTCSQSQSSSTVLAFLTVPQATTTTTRRNALLNLPSSSTALAALSDREREIRKKISSLKKQGRIKKQSDNDDEEDDYSARVVQKLGSAKSKLLGYTVDRQEERFEDDDDDDEEEVVAMDARAQIGQRTDMPEVVEESNEPTTFESPPTNAAERKAIINPDLFDNIPEQEEDSRLDSDDYLEQVALKLAAKKALEKRQRDEAEKERLVEVRRLREENYKPSVTSTAAAATSQDTTLEATQTIAEAPPQQLTSGVGGSWTKNETAAQDEAEVYKPKTGSWGYFPRPRDISKAYGGGKRVGVGYSSEASKDKSTEDTRERLKQYRERVGIDVASEKIHADEIEQALAIAGLAMQRGIYTTAVSALEKVTKHCSTNSRVGGKVFLELAMAYEAAGRTKEAITIYGTLTKCRIEEIKVNAKRLLYGVEAMQFMRDDMRSAEFSRTAAKSVFMDTTGMNNIASHFDDVYNTAYIDLDASSYKRLTESVVRSPREARQILLRAKGPGEVSRLRIVQALRSLSRRFDQALNQEITRNAPVAESVAVMDGKPIVQAVKDESPFIEIDGFVLPQATQMVENLNGEWRLQLLADKRGDGVKFFNSTLSWQAIDTDNMSFAAEVPSGFTTVQQTGIVEFNKKKRILRRSAVEVSGGGVLAGLFGTTNGASGAVRRPQQVVSVDSTLLMTRCVPNQRRSNKEDEKEYFALWRKVDDGTFSRKSR